MDARTGNTPMVNGIGDILNKLQGAKPLQKGEYTAHCPAHEDTKPSLTLKQEGDSILLHCQAGCSPESVCQAIGISTADLFIKGDKLPKPELVKTYDYTDETGQLLYQVCRYEPKTFKQRRPDGTGWSWSLNGARRVLYNLPAVILAGTVYHVEGEKDADNLMKCNLVASTSCGGASGWKPEYADSYIGKKVVIIPDNDAPGYGYARAVAASLVGKAHEVKVILLDDVKDITEWLEAGNDPASLKELEQEVNAINANNANCAINAINASNATNATNSNEANNPNDTNKPYQMVARLVREYIEIHMGEKFDLDTICRQLSITERDSRKYVTIELSRKIEQGKLEKVSTARGSLYTVLNNTLVYINDWIDAKDDEILDVRWPCSHQDATEFGFEKTMIVPAGGLAVIAGVSNMGKTGFLQNFCIENCDQYHVTMMINEANKSKFKRRIQRMAWFNPRGEDGKVKFDLIERHSDWKYAIQPDDINIIDWIDLPDGDFYKINGVLDGIKSRLRKGIALVALQKSEGKTLGTGGQFSEHLADIYINIDFQRLTVRKCKEWNAPNPNGKIWGFEIVEGGSQFADIREIRLCPRCGGRSLAAHTHCEDCHGTGYTDKETNH